MFNVRFDDIIIVAHKYLDLYRQADVVLLKQKNLRDRCLLKNHYVVLMDSLQQHYHLSLQRDLAWAHA